jgi:sugar lactone lactonase YvrE
MDADENYIYFVLYNTNCIAIYNKKGEYIRQVDLPVTKGEPENISHVGDLFYIVYNNSSWTGGIVYETVIREKK